MADIIKVNITEKEVVKIDIINKEIIKANIISKQKFDVNLTSKEIVKIEIADKELIKVNFTEISRISGGDMTKAIYDTDNDGIVDKAESVDDGEGNSTTALEIVDSIAESHSHSNKSLLDTYNQTNSDIEDAVNKKHEHTNKTELDKITDGDHDVISSGNPHSVTKSEVGLSDVPNLDTTNAVTNEHIHTNKVLLDTYSQTEVDLNDAVSKKHIQNEDTALGAQSEDLDMNSHKIINLTDPILATDAVNREYLEWLAILSG